MLVVFRMLQGLGAGALQPTEQAILRQTFPPKEQGMAMALFGVAVVIGPAVGPTLGGYIVDNYAWPWIFYINLPVGVLALFMVTRFVHEPEDIRAANIAMAAEQQRKHIDWAGIALLTLGPRHAPVRARRGQQDDWFDSHDHHGVRGCFGGRARGVRHPRAHRRVSRRQHLALSRTPSSRRARSSAR